MEISTHINWDEPEDKDSPNIVARVSISDSDRQWYLRSSDFTVWLNKEKIKNAPFLKYIRWQWGKQFISYKMS